MSKNVEEKHVCAQCGDPIERMVWEGDWRFSWTNDLCGYEDCTNIPLNNEDFARLFPMHEKRFRYEQKHGTTCPLCHGCPQMGWGRDSTYRICYVCKYKEIIE